MIARPLHLYVGGSPTGRCPRRRQNSATRVARGCWCRLVRGDGELCSVDAENCTDCRRLGRLESRSVAAQDDVLHLASAVNRKPNSERMRSTQHNP
jgi:hypothetical protein